MSSLTIFANFRINDDERFLRMKDSLMSFKDINAAQWVINVRGQYKNETRAFLREQLGPRLALFELESPEGWFHDARIMTKTINSDFVLFWIEDHLNLVRDMSEYDEILSEMQSAKVEFMFYSFLWQVKQYDLIKKNELKYISWFDLTRGNFKLVLKRDPGGYIIGCTAFFSGELFKRIVGSDDPRQAIKWPKETPFDFEKSSHDRHWLPIRVGVPKKELFACIDDDSIALGSSLMSRGLYPARERRLKMGAPSLSPIRYPKSEPNHLVRIYRKAKRLVKGMLLRR